MSIAYWNTAQTLFWIITRQWPANALLDDDSISALQLALSVSQEATKQISGATNELRIAMRSGDRISSPILLPSTAIAWDGGAEGARSPLKNHWLLWKPSLKASFEPQGVFPKVETLRGVLLYRKRQRLNTAVKASSQFRDCGGATALVG
jgi:hypothetical protein